MPQTGSLWSTPPGRTGGGAEAAGGREAGRRNPAKTLRNTARKNKKSSRGITNSRIRAEIMRSGPDHGIQPRILSSYFFFLAALGFLKLVSMLPPNCAIMSLQACAFGPVGAISRYFWNASNVPGGKTNLPSLSTVA